MEAQQKNRDFYFDTLKGLLILFVIIGNSLELASPQNIDTHYFILFLYMFHMPMFTFVSGYFSKLSKRTTVQKVKSTFKLYVFAQLTYIIFYKYLLGNSGYKFELMYSQWTLWYLLSLTCWYILSDYVTDKKKWIIGSIIVSLILGFDNTIGLLANMSRTLFFFPFFITGMTFKKEYIDVLKKHIIKLLVGSLLVLIILYILSHDIKIELLFESAPYSSYYDNLAFPFCIRLFHYIGSFILGASILTFIPNFKTIFSSLGRNSLLLYLLHGGISYIFITLGFTRYNNLFALILSELLIIGVTILCAKAFLKIKKIYLFKKGNIK